MVGDTLANLSQRVYLNQWPFCFVVDAKAASMRQQSAIFLTASLIWDEWDMPNAGIRTMTDSVVLRLTNHNPIRSITKPDVGD